MVNGVARMARSEANSIGSVVVILHYPIYHDWRVASKGGPRDGGRHSRVVDRSVLVLTSLAGGPSTAMPLLRTSRRSQA